MPFSVRIKSSAAKDLAAVARPQRERLIEAIDRLSTDPLRGTVLKGNLTGLRRVRVGDYRILYEVQHGELIVLLIRVAHRREMYRY